MRKLTALAGVAVLGLSAQAAFGYGGTANLTFTFGGSTNGANSDQGWTSAAGPVAIAGAMSNGTTFSQLSGAISTSYYNADFASVADCAIGGAYVPGTAQSSSARKYGCRFVSSGGGAGYAGTTPTDAGPVGQASGSLTVTDTTLTGTLTILSTTDEPSGATTTFGSGASGTTRLSNSVGNGFNGYNYRTADGSPFGNTWYGVTTAGTLNVNLTGTFTAGSWSITGGSVTFTDAGFACAQSGNGGTDARGTLCQGSTTGGGFNPNGDHLSWGIDVDAAATGTTLATQIDVRDAGGTTTIATLAGVIASLSLDGSGNITSGTGEFRRGGGAAAGGCINHIRFDTTSGNLTCGSLTAGNLAITGNVIPVPAAVWLMGSALGLLGWVRRKATA